MADYNLDELRAAVEETRRGPLLLGGNPHQDMADAIEYSQSLDRVRHSLLQAARAGLLDDAALGRAVRAAAERDGPERRAVRDAIADADPFSSGIMYEPEALAAARALIAMGEQVSGINAHARTIEKHEQPPVDPDVLAVREILAVWYGADRSMAKEVNDGVYDNDDDFQAALTTYRRVKNGGAS